MTRVALVTGGTRGIGLAISSQLKSDGFTVVACYASDEKAASDCEDVIGITTIKLNVSDFDACAEAARRIERDIGAIEVLVNNAGITRDTMFHRMTREQWTNVLSVNLDSMFNMTRPVIEGMRERGHGRIICISSINAQKGQAGQTNYSASKAGIIGFVKALALENARKRVTVNCICPGYIETDMVAAIDQSFLENLVAQIPIGRLGQASEIAEVVSFLASERAAYITGATFSINGGLHLS